LLSVVYWCSHSPRDFKEPSSNIIIAIFAVSQEVHHMKVMVATCQNSHMEKSNSFISGVNLLIRGHRVCITINCFLLMVIAFNCKVRMCSSMHKNWFFNFVNLSNLSKTNIIVFWFVLMFVDPFILYYVINNVPIRMYLRLYNLRHVYNLLFFFSSFWTSIINNMINSNRNCTSINNINSINNSI